MNIVNTVMNLLIELNHRISPKLTQTKRDRISGDFGQCIHRLSVFVLNRRHSSENSLHDIDQSIDTDPPPWRKDAAQFVSRCVLPQRFLERFYEHPYGKIRIDLLSARSSAVAKQIFLHGSLLWLITQSCGRYIWRSTLQHKVISPSTQSFSECLPKRWH